MNVFEDILETTIYININCIRVNEYTKKHIMNNEKLVKFTK